MVLNEVCTPTPELKAPPRIIPKAILIDKTPQLTRNRSNEIHALTGLRGIAGILVVLCHLAVPKEIANAFPFLINIKEFGWFGVPIYFALSGYLITWLALKEIHATGTLSLKFFYLRRLLRVYPLYIFICTLGLSAWLIPSLRNEAATSPIWILPILTSTVNFSITFFNHWQYIGFLGIFWTLSLEEQFYVFWGIALKWLTDRKLILVATSIMIFCFIWRLHPLPFSNFLEYRIDPPCSLATIMAGCVLALLAKNKQTRSWRTITKISLFTVLGLVLLIALEWPFSTKTLGCFNTITAADILSCLLVFLCYQKLGLFSKMLSWKPMTHLGDISFCMYAINIPIIHFCNHMEKKIDLFKQLTQTHALRAFLAETIIVYLLVIALASFWILIDRPITNLRYRLKRV